MQALVLVEINEKGEVYGKPTLVYKQNVNQKQLDEYFQRCENALRFQKTQQQITQNQQIRLQANFEEITQMGFVHHSEIERILDRKITEIHQRSYLFFTWEYYFVKPFKALKFKILAKLGKKIYKKYKSEINV